MSYEKKKIYVSRKGDGIKMIKRIEKMSEPLLSVVVPIYNVEEYLEKCIESIVTQTYSNLEIILVNDGSTDGCLEICRKWEKQDKRIIVIDKLNGGLSDARNEGMKIASGELITFVDSDDFIDQEMYKKMIEKKKKVNSEICVCGIKRIRESGEIQKAYESSIEYCDKEQALKLLFQGRICMAVWNKIYDTRLFKNLKFPKGKIYEDEFTTPYIFEQATSIAFVNEYFYNYLIRTGSILRTKFSEKRIHKIEAVKKQYQYFSKQYPVMTNLLMKKYYESVRDVYCESLSTKEEEIKKRLYLELKKISKEYIKTVNIREKRYILALIINYKFSKWYCLRKG